jgi:hypothetical protein
MYFALMLVLLSALLLVLPYVFPEAVLPQDAHWRVLYLAALVMLVGSSAALSRLSKKHQWQFALAWLAIFAGVMLIYELLAKPAG